MTMDAFVKAYETLGYRLCFGDALEPGLEKIAIFGIERNGITVPTHAALQLQSGEWTSKLGDFEDIRHANPDNVNGPVYGRPVAFMARAITSITI